MMEKVFDVISRLVHDDGQHGFDRKNLSWAFEIKQLNPFFEFMGSLDDENILSQNELQIYEWLKDRGIYEKLEAVHVNVDDSIKALSSTSTSEDYLISLKRESERLDSLIERQALQTAIIDESLAQAQASISHQEEIIAREKKTEEMLKASAVDIGASLESVVHSLLEAVDSIQNILQSPDLKDENCRFFCQLQGAMKQFHEREDDFMSAMGDYFSKQFSSNYLNDMSTATTIDSFSCKGLSVEDREKFGYEIERLQDALTLSQIQEYLAQIKVAANQKFLKGTPCKYDAMADEKVKLELSRKQDHLKAIIRDNINLEFYNFMKGEYDAKLERQNDILRKLKDCDGWLRKQYSWQLFLLALFDCQEGRIDDLVELMEGLLGYSKGLIQGFQDRKSLLEQSSKSKDTVFSYDKLAIHEKDSFLRALANVLDSDKINQEHGVLSWNDIETLIRDKISQTMHSTESETLSEMQRIYHDLNQELLKHSKTRSQILLVPERLYDLQVRFRDSTQRLQPILQNASNEMKISTLLAQQKQVFHEFYARSGQQG